VAETIENNVRKLIINESPVDPAYYDKMSKLLDALIEQRRKGALAYKEVPGRDRGADQGCRTPAAAGFTRRGGSTRPPSGRCTTTWGKLRGSLRSGWTPRLSRASRTTGGQPHQDQDGANAIGKDIKNLHLAVYPPDGRVRVAAPLLVGDEAVRLAVISRLAWIRRQQGKFAQQERQSAREYVSGESHYYLGRRYLLNVVYRAGVPSVAMRNNTTLDLFVRPGSDTAQRERVLFTWYRRQLKQLIPPLVAKWEAIIGVEVAEWRVKQMKTRWGACNPEARRIWLNLRADQEAGQLRRVHRRPRDCCTWPSRITASASWRS
jgi:predicted metal-dependent hydrolase